MSPDWARPVVHWEIEAKDPERRRAFSPRCSTGLSATCPSWRSPPASVGPSPDRPGTSERASARA